ncbi:DUF4352 domain-containing protein [Williamsia phyllosphaerae]|nr:DUF4352 domain-containing protein [Williamsia phyllosphaerae]
MTSDSNSARYTTPSTNAAPYEGPITVTTTKTATPMSLIGQPVSTGTARVTVQNVTYPNTVEKYEENGGDDYFATIAPPAGGKFVLVEAVVENAGSQGDNVYLEGWVKSKLVDNQNRAFDTIRNVYQIRQNYDRMSEELIGDLQPGFSVKMYYLFQLPPNSSPRAIAFIDNRIRPQLMAYSYVQI